MKIKGKGKGKKVIIDFRTKEMLVQWQSALNAVSLAEKAEGLRHELGKRRTRHRRGTRRRVSRKRRGVIRM